MPYNHVHNNAELFRPRESYAKKSPTILEYFVESLMNKFKKRDSYTSRRRSPLQKRRVKFDSPRFERPRSMYRPRRTFNSDSINSVLVDCRYAIPRQVRCSKKFRYGHLRCCSLVERKYRRRF